MQKSNPERLAWLMWAPYRVQVTWGPKLHVLLDKWMQKWPLTSAQAFQKKTAINSNIAAPGQIDWVFLWGRIWRLMYFGWQEVTLITVLTTTTRILQKRSLCCASCSVCELGAKGAMKWAICPRPAAKASAKNSMAEIADFFLLLEMKTTGSWLR